MNDAHTSIKDWRKLEFFAPITESMNLNGDFLIKGIAINETTTRNGITYIGEELKPSAETLRDKPILKDHINSVDSIVGRTTENVFYDDSGKNIRFEARIVDKAVQEKIKMGLIKNVSIGATVQDIEKKEMSEGHQMIARGIDFVELSLVAVPADKGAGFAQAMMESFRLKEAEIPIVKQEVVEDLHMEKVEQVQVPSVAEELQKQVLKLQEEIAKMQIEKLEAEKAKLVAEIKVSEKKVMEDKTVGEVAPVKSAQASLFDGYVIEQSGKGFAMYKRGI